eukprot:gnl/Trimastix_PCT/1306.p1 GENE.gnl/Trimastix_PCT/1306~~gnl/Trimastix_PCT/1306.p1  ORF type:complete len:543 (+),score=32.74 gnl/Trimastix_PCT/1306:907-2535(+)
MTRFSILLLICTIFIIPSHSLIQTQTVQTTSRLSSFGSFGFLKGGSINITATVKHITNGTRVHLLICTDKQLTMLSQQNYFALSQSRCNNLIHSVDYRQVLVQLNSVGSTPFTYVVTQDAVLHFLLSNCDTNSGDPAFQFDIESHFYNPNKEHLSSGYIILPTYCIGASICFITLGLVWVTWLLASLRRGTYTLQRLLVVLPFTKALHSLLMLLYWSVLHLDGHPQLALNIVACLGRSIFMFTIFALLLLIARGWRMTRLTLQRNEVSIILLCTSGLALADFLFAFLGGFLVFGVMLMYFAVLRFAFVAIVENKRALVIQLRMVEQAHVEPRTTPAFHKLHFFFNFGILLVGYVGAVLLMHIISLFLSHSVAFLDWVFRDFTSLAMFIALGWFFRFRKDNPYFTRLPQEDPGPMDSETPPFVIIENPASDKGSQYYLGTVIERIQPGADDAEIIDGTPPPSPRLPLLPRGVSDSEEAGSPLPPIISASGVEEQERGVMREGEGEGVCVTQPLLPQGEIRRSDSPLANEPPDPHPQPSPPSLT